MTNITKPTEMKTFDALVSEQVNLTLKKGTLASTLMAFISAIILFVLTSMKIVKGVEVPIMWTLIGGIYSLAIFFLARKQKITGKITYAVMLGFCTLPTTIFIIAFFLLPSGTATYITGPPGYLYFFLILITGFAFNFKLSLIAGIYSAIQYSIASELAIPYLKMVSGPDSLLIQDLSEASFYHFKSMMMAISGFAVGIVSKHVRTLIQDTLTKERENLQVSRLFGQFVSNEVKDKILQHGISGQGTSISSGERKSVAILFADIRGFTSFSETTPPEKVVEYLNEYLDAMVKEINLAFGTIDKFIGDAIMAVFGGLLEVENSSDAAVKAALAMRASLQRLNSNRTAKGLPMIQIGIGIHFGEVVQGAIGSQERKDFTVIGDAVNSASRLEGLCKDFSCDLLFSKEVYQNLSPALKVRAKSLGQSPVKGRHQTFELWTID